MNAVWFSQRMDVSDLLAELVTREKRQPPGLIRAGTEPILSKEDLLRWASSTGLNNADLLDAIALALANDYDRGELSFSQCDLIVNDLDSCALWASVPVQDLFLSVYSAFDAGEYYHDNDRTKDPEQEFTRPQIGKVLREARDG